MRLHPFDTGWSDGFKPDPLITVSQWADMYRQLPSKGAAEHGQWRTARTPYLREPMDCLSPHSPVQKVAMMFGAQTGKSESGFNWIGSTAHYYPCPMLMVQPTIQIAERVSKQRIDSMIQSTPVLASAFLANKSRDGGNTLLIKDFRGGTLILSGANSAASLASMPIRNLFMDEVDRWVGDLEDEGSPIMIALERCNSFGARKKVLITSTPTIKGASHIETFFQAGDQRRYFCPCPQCGDADYWRWENFRWEPGEPSSVHLLCKHCGALIEERSKTWMMAEENGAQWRPMATASDPTLRSYHLPGMYSPLGWKSWEDMARQFIAGQRDQSILKTFVNVGLAETWEEQGETHDAHDLMARAEDYPAEVPENVALMTMSVDVQRDRLEAAIYGWGPGEESWLIDHQRFDGIPSTDPGVWESVDEMRLRERTRTDGVKLRPVICLVDSGDGDNIDPVYEFVYPRQRQGVYATKGVQHHTRPVLVQASQVKGGKIRLFTIATHAAKQLIYDRLKIKSAGPACIHFPTWATEEYYAQLTGEKLVGEEVKRTRRKVYKWIKTHTNNEALDLTVYALGGLRILQTILAPRLFGDLDIALKNSRGVTDQQPRGRRVMSSLR